jgi:3'-phosphoadenosine 5'-phosphosulfate sulfotransferase (PAPS reductase)/FAD synthetase
MRHIMPISGKDSLTTAIICKEQNPEFEFEYIYNQIGTELPETLVWLDKVEKSLNIKIKRFGRNLNEVIREEKMLPSSLVRFCTRITKIQPTLDYIGTDDAVLYLGLRADEPARVGLKSPGDNLTVFYPLKSENIKINDVYRIVNENGLKPPTFFWSRLFNEVKKRLGKDCYLLDLLPEYIKDIYFAGRSRPNCYYCFFQRRYEWVWLLEEHLGLFETAENLEKEFETADRRESSYYLIGKDFPLSRIRENKEKYFNDRVNQIIKIIRKHQQLNIFDNSENPFFMLEIQTDLISSCGMFCGK